MKKHEGLFESIKISAGKLKSEKYFINTKPQTKLKYATKLKVKPISYEDREYKVEQLRYDIKDSVKSINAHGNEEWAKRTTLKDVPGFINSTVFESEECRLLREGDKREQAQFLYYSTIQFYYEFSVKLNQSLQLFNKSIGTSWTLNMNMKENIIRIQEKIMEFQDRNMKLNK